MTTENPTAESRPVFTGLPAGIAPYIAILGALASTYVHLSMAPMMMQFDPTRGVLFVLAGLGFVGGIAVYLTRYWRRELYLAAIACAFVQIVAWVVLSGFLSEMAVLSKAGEAVFSVAAAYLYLTDEPSAA